MFNRYLIYLSVIYNCLLQYSIIYNRTFCKDNTYNIQQSLCCGGGVVLCVPAVLLRGVSSAAGEQLTLTRYLPPTPAPAPSQPPPRRRKLQSACDSSRRGGDSGEAESAPTPASGATWSHHSCSTPRCCRPHSGQSPSCPL